MAVPTELINDVDGKLVEEGKWSRINFRKSLDVLPVAGRKTNAPDLSCAGRKQRYGAGGILGTSDYYQRARFYALEEGFRIDLAFFKD